MTEKYEPGNQFYEAALVCVMHCEGLLAGIHPFYAEALRIYSAISDQVIVAGFGDVIGLQHEAVHKYMERSGYLGGGELRYQKLFEKVLDIHRKLHSKKGITLTNNGKSPSSPSSSDLSSSSHPSSLTSKTIPRTPRPIRPQQN